LVATNPRTNTMNETASAMRSQRISSASAAEEHDARGTCPWLAPIISPRPIDFSRYWSRRKSVHDDGKKYRNGESGDLGSVAEPERGAATAASTRFSDGKSAAISGSKKMRTGLNMAINRPVATRDGADDEAGEHAHKRHSGMACEFALRMSVRTARDVVSGRDESAIADAGHSSTATR